MNSGLFFSPKMTRYIKPKRLNVPRKSERRYLKKKKRRGEYFHILFSRVIWLHERKLNNWDGQVFFFFPSFAVQTFCRSLKRRGARCMIKTGGGVRKGESVFFCFFSPRASSGFHLCVRRHRAEEWMRERKRRGEAYISHYIRDAPPRHASCRHLDVF